MTVPKDGDFAAFLNQQQAQRTAPLPDEPATDSASADQTEGVLSLSAETLMDDQAIDRLAAQMREEAQAMAALPPMTDEELERQALADGGADNDPSTPE